MTSQKLNFEAVQWGVRSGLISFAESSPQRKQKEPFKSKTEGQQRKAAYQRAYRMANLERIRSKQRIYQRKWKAKQKARYEIHD